MSKETRIQNGRVDFFTQDFNELIKTKGMNVDWEQAMVCQCITNDTNQPDFNCKYCKGSGYRYLPPKRIKVVSSAFNSSTKLETLGIREPGIAYVTPPNEIIMGYRDRLRYVDFRCKYSETIRFDSETGISSVTYRNINEILYLVQDDTLYEQGVDYDVMSDRHRIKWNKKYAIPLNQVNFTILYLTTPSYLVVDLLHELRATITKIMTPEEMFKELPKQYQISREDFVYGVTINRNKENPDKEEKSKYSDGENYEY